MTHIQTNLKIIDNSGAKLGQCIKILGAHKKKYAEVGDLILVNIKSATPGQVKKGAIYKALVIRSKKNFKKNNQIVLNCANNAIVLVKETPKTGELYCLASRIKGLISLSLRKKKKNKKILSLATTVL